MFIPILIHQLIIVIVVGILGLPNPERPAQDEPGTLSVVDGDIHLPVGTFSGTFEVVHTGGGPVEWEWVGDPRVAVSEDNGVLEPGAATVVSFQIDASALDPGSNLLANCVAFDGGASDVWITVTTFTPPTIPQHLTS